MERYLCNCIKGQEIDVHRKLCQSVDKEINTIKSSKDLVSEGTTRYPHAKIPRI